MSSKQTVFVVADHGLAIIYFMQSQIVSRLVEAGKQVVLLTQDALTEQIQQKFGRSGLIVEGLRYDLCDSYARHFEPRKQWWLNFLRRVGTSNKINTEAMDSYVRQVDFETQGKQRIILEFAKQAVKLLRKSNTLRKYLIQKQMRYIPNLYQDLFEKYNPTLLVSCTYGWRNDRYILRESKRRGIKTGAVIVGWDNPSSYGIPAAPLDFVTCWSEAQKRELVDGSDWSDSKVNIGGIPSYDNYFNGSWLMSREEYFAKHNLDPARKLVSYACSFVTFSPNMRNVTALAKLVVEDQLREPTQLLVRLHPNHYLDDPLFAAEREQIIKLMNSHPHLHLVTPVALAGNLGNYSGEDMDEKTSMMAHSDVFTTVYSTMCVECAIHDRPIVSVVLDTPGGWNNPDKFSLALSEIGGWPTHSRFIRSGAGKLAEDEETLKQHLDTYLDDYTLDRSARQKFVKDEITYLDGTAGNRTADYLLSLIEG